MHSRLTKDDVRCLKQCVLAHARPMTSAIQVVLSREVQGERCSSLFFSCQIEVGLIRLTHQQQELKAFQPA